MWALNSPKVDTRSRESNFGPHDCKADALPHDHGHHHYSFQYTLKLGYNTIKSLINHSINLLHVHCSVHTFSIPNTIKTLTFEFRVNCTEHTSSPLCAFLNVLIHRLDTPSQTFIWPSLEHVVYRLAFGLYFACKEQGKPISLFNPLPHVKLELVTECHLIPPMSSSHIHDTYLEKMAKFKEKQFLCLYSIDTHFNASTTDSF